MPSVHGRHRDEIGAVASKVCRWGRNVADYPMHDKCTSRSLRAVENREEVHQ